MTRRRRPRTAQERVIGVLGTVAPGSLGGRIRNTRPATVVQPNTGGPPDTGPAFDPNENPIIIGLGATAGGTSTPDDVSTGALGAVVIGWDAYADGQYDIAIGFGATVDGVIERGIAIGSQATVEGLYGIAVGYLSFAQLADSPIAIGPHANVSADRGVAIGKFADVAGVDGVAVGNGAYAPNAHSAALGADAVTTKNNQIMLGTHSDFVEIPGDSSTAPNGVVFTDTDGSGNRWIAQVTGGAWALSAAP